MNGTPLEGSQHFVGLVQPCREREIELRAKGNIYTNVYIKNIGDDVDDECLKNVFSKFGSVLNFRVMTDESGSSKHFGIVSFENLKMPRKPSK